MKTPFSVDKNRHVVVLSADAMVFEDVEQFSKMYPLCKFWDKTARVDKVRSIYPTITYPCHVTMMSGTYPEKHGVVNNEQFIPGRKGCPWVHMRESVQVETIFDRAKAAGLTTAGVYWPVTGNDKSIDYLIDEYWPQTPEETSIECFQNSGSSPEVIEKIIKPNLPLIENRHRIHPYHDNFVMRCAADVLREFKPNLLMIHPANIDGYRHETGLFSPKVTQGLYETALWLDLLMKAADDAGILEQTDFFIVSDHGQMDIRRSVHLNVLLAEQGLITVGEDGEVADWKAWVQSSGLSAQVFLKDPEDKAVWQQVYDLLLKLRDEQVYGVSEVFTVEEACEKHHLSGKFSFVLETDNMTTFGNDWNRPLMRALNNSDYRFGRATHGYLPEKSLQPTLMCWGPDIQPGAHYDNARLIDEAPTYAYLLGIELPGAQGEPLTELFKK